MKGFRYEITVYYYGDGANPDFFRLGVRFPDNTEVKPISKAYLKRSMGRYKRTDVKIQKGLNGFYTKYTYISVFCTTDTSC